MKILFDNFRDARKAIGELKFPTNALIVLCQEGSVRKPPPDSASWTLGTGRWFITDNVRVPDRCVFNSWGWMRK